LSQTLRVLDCLKAQKKIVGAIALTIIIWTQDVQAMGAKNQFFPYPVIWDNTFLDEVQGP